MKPGTKVIIRQNPHHINVEHVLGTVVKYRAGEGFMGIDLFDVEYMDPKTGETHVRPFGQHSLDNAELDHLIELAERWERMAAEMRE